MSSTNGCLGRVTGPELGAARTTLPPAGRESASTVTADIDTMMLGRVRLTFDGQVPSSIQCEGLLHSRINGREAAVAVSKFDEEKTIGQLKTYNPADIQIERLNLEDAFVEYVGAAERGDR